MIRKRKILFLFLIMPLAAFSQEEAAFSVSFEDAYLTDVLDFIEDSYNVRFSYQNELVQNLRVTIPNEKRTLKQTLRILTELTNIRYEMLSNRYIILQPDGISVEEIQILQDVIVKSYLARGITKSKDGTYRISPKELDVLPGLTEADVLESIQLLPGVTSPNETATGFTVRGGAQDQNRMIFDGINIYHKGHLFGMISPFNPNSVAQVDFYNKGTHPRFGERVSSVINITTKDEISKATEATLGINGLATDAFIEIPVIEDKLSIQGSIRRSYSEVWQSFTFENLATKVFQTTKIDNAMNTNNNFSFLDYQIKANYQFNSVHRFSFSTIFIDNRLDYLVSDPVAPLSFNDILQSKNSGTSFTMNSEWPNGMRLKTTAHSSKYRFSYNFITAANQERLTNFDKRNIVFDSGLSTEFEFAPQEDDKIQAGYQYNLKDVGYAFLQTAESNFVLDSDQRIVQTHAFYGNYQYRQHPFFDIDAGIRVNYFKELGTFGVEPRMVIGKNISNSLKAKITAEVKNQIISEIDETVVSDLSLENKLWRLSDGAEAPLITSSQASIGVIYIRKGWTLDVDHYYKRIEGVTALSLGFLNPNDPNFRIGNQKILGLDVYAKKDFRKLKVWASYTFNRVRSKYDGLNNDRSFPAASNIRHVFTSSLAYKTGNFQVAVSWNWRSGKPFTQAIRDPEDDSLRFESINSEELPAYHRMDLSSTYEFKLTKNNPLRCKIGLSIRNVYDRKNQLSREYTGNNNLNDAVAAVDKFSLGFTPNFLFRVSW